jgi:exosome complex RNA-binding protein Rrp42 (RNase PH superfamily)
MDGDILDASSIATFIALSSTKVPKVDVIVGESGNLEDFDVVGFLSSGVDIATQKMPVLITVAKVSHATGAKLSTAVTQKC